MILGGFYPDNYEPSPPRAGSFDDCEARGFDPKSVEHDRVTPERLSPEWQAALNRSLEIVRALREEER